LRLESEIETEDEPESLRDSRLESDNDPLRESDAEFEDSRESEVE